MTLLKEAVTACTLPTLLSQGVVAGRYNDLDEVGGSEAETEVQILLRTITVLLVLLSRPGINLERLYV
jgi:hypothetical protein